MLENDDYVEATQILRPDVVLGMGDVVFGHQPGVKRVDKMGDRTLSWMNELIAGMKDEESETPGTALFAPILPIEPEQQSYYLDALQDELKDDISGLVLYDAGSIEAIPRALQHLPRLWLGESNSPHRILDQIAAGVDIFTISFITEATDAGISLDFSFTDISRNSTDLPLPLGIDLWSHIHATSLTPLRSNCICYTCTYHHRAFIQHLLNAKEMLGWVLLQLHNHHIIDLFFVAVRQSIQNCSFEDHKKAFRKTYEAELPAKTGQGPRVRGYQFKSSMGEVKKNAVAYRPMDNGQEKVAEGVVPCPGADAGDLEQHDFAERTDTLGLKS